MRALPITPAPMLDPDTTATGAAWKWDRILIWDHTAPEWKPLVERVVCQINAILPTHAPYLVYRRRTETRCEDLPERGDFGGVLVCLAHDLGAGGQAEYATEGDAITSARVSLWGGEDERHRANAICHELMHALTDMPDRDQSPELEDQSCVWGFLDGPGPLDVAYAKRAYRQRGSHR